MTAPSEQPICILLCVDTAYLAQASVTLASILESNPDTRFDVYVAGPDLDPRRFDAVFAPILAQHPACALHRRDLDAADLADLPVTQQFSHSIYTRILFDRYVDRHHRRVLYLDSDIVVRTDLAPLWSTPLDGAVLAAVRDHFRLDPEAIGFGPDEPYFNSGVLLFDRERWHALDCERRVLEFLAREAARLPWMDQDALNIVLRGQVHFVGLTWNFQPRCADVPADFLGLSEAEFADLRTAPGIVHYTTSHKPWNAGFRIHYSRWFFQAARAAGLSMAPARPKTARDRLMQTKTWMRWHFPRAFRALRKALRPESAAMMYRARAGH